MKAEELDKKGDAKGKKKNKYQEEIAKELVLMRTEVSNDGVTCYNKKDYKGALASFAFTLDVDKMDAYLSKQQGEASIDTGTMFNAAIAAYYDKQHNLAIDYLNQIVDLNYGGENPYLMLYTEYRDIKDTTNMVEVLKKGFEKYPENEIFIKDLVVYYINNNKMEEGMEYIDKALERDPKNTGFLFAKATFLDKKGELDAAIDLYKRVLESTEDAETKYNAHYNLGVIYYNKAVEKFDEANAIQDYNKYKAAMKVAYDAMRKALPDFEACYSLKPDDKATATTLSSVYYRLSKDDPEMSKKYAELKAKLDSM